MRRPVRITLWLIFAVAVLAGLAVVQALWLRQRASSELAALQRISSPTGVDLSEAVQIGGAQQWISIRGRDSGNPVLLYLHGGPGGSARGLNWSYQRGWEDYFTVVNWDQRGAGRTFADADEAARNAPLTFAQMLADTEELAAYILKRLQKQKLIVVGHSWGTLLGLSLASRRPEWVHAYVGMGQVVDMRGNEAASYAAVLAEARAREDVEAVRELESIAPYPGEGTPTIEQLIVARKWIARYGRVWGGLDDLSALAVLTFLSPEVRLRDLSAMGQAEQYSARALLDELFTTIDVRSLSPEFATPIFMFMGSEDLGTPPQIAKRYFEEIRAPHKEFVIFEGAGHFVMMERPGETLVRLVNDVRPFALSADASPVVAEP